MSKVFITPDPDHPDWWIASGTDLLADTHRIGSVEAIPGGIAYHEDFADEVRAALYTAGHTLIDGTPRSSTRTTHPRHGVSGWHHPPGEELECPRCNPAHDPAPAITEAKQAVAEAIAAMKARTI